MKKQSQEQGQIILLLAMGMVVLLMFAALAIDGGNIYTNKRIAQNSADSAALAGAQKLQQLCKDGSRDYTQVLATIQNYVQMNAGPASQTKNGVTSFGSSYSAYYIDAQGSRLNGGLTINAVGTIPCGCVNNQSVGYQATGVEVVVNKTFGSFLAGLIGRGQSAATAGAKANYGVSTPTSVNQFHATDIYPIAVPVDDYYVGEDIVLFDDKPGPGNFGWLSWRNTNDNPDLDDSLQLPPVPPNTVANYVNPDLGKKGEPDAPLTAGKRVSGGPGLKASGIDAIKEHTIVLPLYDPNPQLTNGQGSNYNYYIVGFLAVKLHEYNKQGKPKSYMTATVQQYVASGEWSNSENTCSTPLFYSEKLTH